MLIPNRHGNSPAYRYGFGGHEKDDEIKGEGNHYDFGNYGYDPRIGRRLNIDPMAAKFPNWSPYNYCLDNPINLVDPTGMAPDGWGRKGDQWEYKKEITKDNYKSLGYSDFSDGKTNNTYNTHNNRTVTLLPNDNFTISKDMTKKVLTPNSVEKTGEITNEVVNDKLMNTALSTTGTIGSTASSIYKDRFKYALEASKKFDHPIIIRTWLGPGIETTSFKLEKFARVGKVVNGVGYGLFAADIVLSGQVRASHGFYGTVMMASTAFPAIGVSVFAADLLIMGGSYLITRQARSIGDIIDNNTNGGVIIDTKDFSNYEGLKGYRK